MIFIHIKRIVLGSFVSFWRHGVVSFTTIMVMVLAIFMVGSLILFQVLLTSTLDQVEQKVDVIAYFKLDAPEDDILHIRELLLRTSEVNSVEYISRDRALEIFKDRNSDNALIASALDELGDNPLGASLRIQAHSPGDYQSVDRFLREGGFSSIDKVNYRDNELVYERLALVLSVARQTGLGIVVVLGVIAFLVVFNTIRLAIYTAKDEIGIMRLVGAANWYVRAPFLVEGAMHGVFASVFATLMFWPLTLWLGPKAKSFFGGPDLFIYYTQHFGSFFVTLLLVGVIIGVFSSFVATRKYLKV